MIQNETKMSGLSDKTRVLPELTLKIYNLHTLHILAEMNANGGKIPTL